MCIIHSLWRNNFGLKCLFQPSQWAHFIIDVGIIDRHARHLYAVFDQPHKNTSQKYIFIFKCRLPSVAGMIPWLLSAVTNNTNSVVVLCAVYFYTWAPPLLSLVAGGWCHWQRERESLQDGTQQGRAGQGDTSEGSAERRKKWAMLQPGSCLWTLWEGCWYSPEGL